MFTFLKKCASVLFFLTSVNIIFPLQVSAFENEPDGFRGLKWGTHISELTDMSLIESNGDIKIYVHKNDKMQFGDAKLKEIVYAFYKDRLFSVSIRYSSYLNYLKLKQIFFRLYGNGNQPNIYMKRYLWIGSAVDISLEYKEMPNKGKIYYFYKPIANEIRRDDEEKARKRGQ